MKIQRRGKIRRSNTDPVDSEVDVEPEHQDDFDCRFIISAWHIDIQKLGCFHDRLSRSRADSLLQRDGDYLVRIARDKYDNALKPVLSVRWTQMHYHYLIRERLDYVHIDDELFASIPHMINYYQKSGLPIGSSSNAPVLLRPVLANQDEVSVSVKSLHTPSTKLAKSAKVPSPLIRSRAGSKEDLPFVITTMLKLVAFSAIVVFLYYCVIRERES